MPRGKQAPKRVIAPDPKYNNVAIAKFTNYLMLDGKKTTAQDIVYGALDIIGEKTKDDPIAVFNKAMEALKPHLEVRSRRVGGANYQVPMPVVGRRQEALAYRWLIAAIRARKGKSMKEKLAGELLDILEGVGAAVKKREDVHRMAESNKAFAHFARFGRR